MQEKRRNYVSKNMASITCTAQRRNEGRLGDVHLRSIKKKVPYPILMLSIVIIGFVLAFASVFPIRTQHMSSSALFVWDVIPLPYWLGVAIIAGATFLMMRYVGDKRFRVFFVVSSILLMIAFRMVFPVIFTSIPAYEPDATNYLNIVNLWATSGVNFGVEGNYQHNFPMSFLIGFVFVKLGVPLDVFFRVAPFFVYVIDMIFVYLLVGEIIPRKKEYAAVSVFLLSFSSLGYWEAVHYCPDLVGSMFFFASLYFSMRFAKNGEWKVKALLPIFVSIFALILSHHLSTLYFIITLLGLSFSVWFFKPSQIKGKALSFLLLAIYTYTLWFVYGTLVYPTFFNVYVYFSGYSSPAGASQGAGLLNNLAFAIYPVFILGLFALGLLGILHVHNIRDAIRLPKKLKEIRSTESSNIPLVFSVGFVFLFILFLGGLVVPVIQSLRMLELLCICASPVASEMLMKIGSGNPSKKKMLIILMLVLFVVVAGAYRYYSQIQRRVLTG